jgi:hypothetical protein
MNRALEDHRMLACSHRLKKGSGGLLFVGEGVDLSGTGLGQELRELIMR